MSIVSSFSSSGKIIYKNNFSISVKTGLDYEVGEIQTDKETYAVMFLKGKSEFSAPKIEFLVNYKKVSSEKDKLDIDKQRNKWMELCNAHDAEELVKQLYTIESYYYNRGRLIEGTKAISAEYIYMNNPGYNLKLTPKHLVIVSSNIAYEIGQCSGSYPLPYMLLWKKQPNGNWQVLMDSNY
jgi:ketosteroid isomerase-like protein